MNTGLKLFAGCVLLYFATSCRSTKKLHTTINKADTTVTVKPAENVIDSFALAAQALDSVKKNVINYTTFSAKIKVQYEDQKGKQPDLNAFIRMYKDSVIWISVNATLLSIEVSRIFITKDTIIVLNKLNKQVEYHNFKYAEDMTHIPLNFSTLQDLIVGNPLYIGDSIVSYGKTGNHILLGTLGNFFKNMLTISAGNNLIEKSKLNDITPGQTRTADITYGSYEKKNNVNFATSREIIVTDKNKTDITLQYKQYDFNNQLSFPFNVPKNYKTK